MGSARDCYIEDGVIHFNVYYAAERSHTAFRKEDRSQITGSGQFKFTFSILMMFHSA